MTIGHISGLPVNIRGILGLSELAGLGARVFGLATQSPEYLAGEVSRIHLPYELLSDEGLVLQAGLSLPLFDVRIAG